MLKNLKKMLLNVTQILKYLQYCLLYLNSELKLLIVINLLLVWPVQQNAGYLDSQWVLHVLKRKCTTTKVDKYMLCCKTRCRFTCLFGCLGWEEYWCFALCILAWLWYKISILIKEPIYKILKIFSSIPFKKSVCMCFIISVAQLRSSFSI